MSEVSENAVLMDAAALVIVVSDPVIEQLGVVCQDLV